jgi:Zn-dependent peptidase ImmA (M78 family)/transcriptional regulator with XRE-family HTH domain
VIKHPVTLARAFSGDTQTSLAKKIGKSQPFVARLENGNAELEIFVPILSQVTKLPESFFRCSSEWIAPDSEISYRKRSHCPAKLKDKAYLYSCFAHNSLSPLISKYVKFPICQVNNYALASEQESGLSSQDASRKAALRGAIIARTVREEWGIGWGPISDLIKLVESKGVRLFYVREPQDFLDGFAFWTDDVPYIFLNSSTTDPARIRMDVAHELGHLLMHRDVHFHDRDGYEEAMAFGFASEFIAPWETLQDEVPPIPDLKRLGMLRRRWGMSMQALVKHMYSNKWISDTVYTNAFKRFSVLGYRRGDEPGWFTPDYSIIHAKFLELAALKGVSISNLAEDYGCSERILGEMIPQSTMNTTELEENLFG